MEPFASFGYTGETAFFKHEGLDLTREEVMLATTVIARATSALGRQTVYDSPGRMPPFEAITWPDKAHNDCSGFVDWCLRFSFSRRVDHPFYVRYNGGWFETGAIHADGLSSVGYFSEISRGRPGAMLVYPDYTDDKGVVHQGHIGIVLEADGDGVSGVTKVIHCGYTAWKTSGDAVQVSGSAIWQGHRNSILVWFDGLDG